MSKILIIGSEGMAGVAVSALLSKQHSVTALSRSQFDILKSGVAQLNVAKFDYVINLAGLINKRAMATPADYIRINAIFPQSLAEVCALSETRLVHLSTDCVFTGKNGPYFEDSPTDSEDPYGFSKRLGEPTKAMVLRTSIIGPEKRNAYNLLCWVLSEEKIKGFTDKLWNGITTVTLAKCLEQILDRDMYVEGTRHIFANDVSKYELVGEICSAFGHHAKITAEASGDPRDLRLTTRYPDWVEQLAIPPIQTQILELTKYSTASGRWRL